MMNQHGMRHEAGKRDGDIRVNGAAARHGGDPARDGTACDRRAEARRGLVVYLGILLALSVPLYVVLAARELPVSRQPGLIILLMWSPAIAAVVTRLLLREGFKGIGLAVLGRASLRPIATALLFPVAVGVVSYGAAWGFGLASFSPAPGAAAAGTAGIARAVLLAVLAGTPLGIVMVAGEEIGWRGYMAERLRSAGIVAPGVVGGLIWAAWHTPLILTGQYAGGPYVLVSVFGFAMLAVGLHLLWSEWLCGTGSLWPAIIGHSAWNAVIQHPFDGHTVGEAASLWVGDSGLLTAGLCLVLAGLLVRFRRGNEEKGGRV
jgi:membrane protease YdiL (CAAX protease family)